MNEFPISDFRFPIEEEGREGLSEIGNRQSAIGNALRFLLVIDNFHPLIGGAEQAALESAKALAARGHRVDVLTMRKQPAWPREEQLGGIRVLRFDERIPPRPFGRLLYERANAKAARRYMDERLADAPYDVMLLHPIVAAFGAIRSRLASRAKVIYCFHAPLAEEHWLAAEKGTGTFWAKPPADPSRDGYGAACARGEPLPDGRGSDVDGGKTYLSPFPLGLFARWAAYASAAQTAHYRAKHQRAAIERADAVTCPSEYSRGLLATVVPQLGGKPIRVIPWGVDPARFYPAPDRPGLRAKLGWGAGETVLFTARRLVPRMGLAELIRAFALAVRERPSLRLAIAGDGPLRGTLEAEARRAGGRVDFLGLVPADELPSYFQAADLFVLPSLTLEAFGLVTLEALACGTPVLATRRCASPEILAPLDERLLIPGCDAPAFAEAILRNGLQAAAEPGFRERCRTYVVERYSWERTAAAFEELAREIATTNVKRV
jgi:glycosyltransferase involved in cell wall biosynthesis